MPEFFKQWLESLSPEQAEEMEGYLGAGESGEDPAPILDEMLRCINGYL